MDESHRKHNGGSTYPAGCSRAQCSDLVERLLSKRLARFDEERRKQEIRMEETVQEFALRLLREESKLTEDAPEGEEAEIAPEASKRSSEPEALIVALNADLVRQIRTAAEECRTTVSSLVGSCVADWLEGYERLKRKRRQIRRLL